MRSFELRNPISESRIPSSGGYALVALMIMVTVMLIGLAAVLPSVYQESQRQKEEELIFRGNEYARAIYLFNRQFHRYPRSVDELLHTNNLSFLRRAYRDPMTPSGKWRFIHATAQGAVLDSVTLNSNNGQPPLGAAASGFGQQGSFGQQNGFPGAAVPTIGGPQQPIPGGFPASSFGQSGPQSGDQAGQAGQPGQGNDQNGAGAAPGEAAKKKKAPPCDESSKDKTGPTSSFFSDSNQPQNTFIVGVASCSDKESIRVWNKHTNYTEWEFMGVAYQPASIGGIGSTPQGTGQGQAGGFGPQPGQPGFGQPGQPGFGQPGQPGQPAFGTGAPGEPPPLTDEPQEPPEPDADNGGEPPPSR